MEFTIDRGMRCLPVCLLLMSCLPAHAETADPLASLRREHPRLLVPADRFARAKEAAGRDPWALAHYNDIKSESTKFLDQPALKRGSGQMLNTSREAQKRITFLAAMYRMDGDRRYFERARDEMLAIAKFADWDPSHFLDTAEMTASMAIGYDWLFDALSGQERAAIRAAIIEKGLKPGLTAYEKGEWWTKVSHNWACVCAGGLALGAFAIADEDPDLARKTLNLTRAAMDRPLANFAPDGGWPEGPAYWNYATKYTVFYIAAAQTALGSDLGLAGAPGFGQTGLFRIYTTGPMGKAFNFADGGEFPGPASQMFWLARQFNRPEFAVAERADSQKWGDVFHLLWFDEGGTNLRDANLPLDALFKHVSIACFRSAWGDPDAFYVGFKGGNNTANHSHLDLGSFVMDAFGQRWAADLGGDDYNLPQYFSDKRFTYYRTRTEGHNTLLIDDANQDENARAPIIAYSSAPGRSLAVADLTAGYPGCTKILRRIELLNRNCVIIQDEIEAKQPAKVQWNLHTPAKIELSGDGRSAELSQGGKSLTARIIAPVDAKFSIGNANPGKPQADNKGISKLVVLLPEKAQSARIVVMLAERANSALEVPPLDEWIKTEK